MGLFPNRTNLAQLHVVLQLFYESVVPGTIVVQHSLSHSVLLNG